jgi:hypothetical protein
MMTVANAVKKLTKSGFEVTGSDMRFSGRNGLRVVEFSRVGRDSDSIGCIKVRSVNDKDDAQSDYSAGVWCDNLSQAIRLALQ